MTEIQSGLGSFEWNFIKMLINAEVVCMFVILTLADMTTHNGHIHMAVNPKYRRVDDNSVNELLIWTAYKKTSCQTMLLNYVQRYFSKISISV